jgi:hypothetical protein
MRIKIGNYPEQDALSGAGLAADRSAFAGPKREINRPDMKSAQRAAFERAYKTCWPNMGESHPEWSSRNDHRLDAIAPRHSRAGFHPGSS